MCAPAYYLTVSLSTKYVANTILYIFSSIYQRGTWKNLKQWNTKPFLNLVTKTTSKPTLYSFKLEYLKPSFNSCLVYFKRFSIQKNYLICATHTWRVNIWTIGSCTGFRILSNFRTLHPLDLWQAGLRKVPDHPKAYI